MKNLKNEAYKDGLTQQEVEKRLVADGKNTIITHRNSDLLIKFLENFKNPLTLLLIALMIISVVTKDNESATVLGIMVLLTVFIKFIQEARADKSAKELSKLILTKADVIRDGKQVEIDVSEVVRGDIVILKSGSMVPADIKLILSKNLFVNQIALTGESLPAEKFISEKEYPSIFEDPNLCFMGTNIESGTATGVVINTGLKTQIGILSKNITQTRPVTAFEKGISSYTWFMMKMIFVLTAAVFIINGLIKGNWLNAFLFAVAIAVGLTPEMLTTIVATCLSKGAVMMHRKKVITKKINAIQNFGAMDVLCTDKTGTLTNGKIILERHMDPAGNESRIAMDYAFINSYFQTGVKNIIDEAIMEHVDRIKEIESYYKKLDEIPFDFVRRRMSVIVENIASQERILICKGAFEEVSSLCCCYEIEGKIYDFNEDYKQKSREVVAYYNNDGFRVVAVAYKKTSTADEPYLVDDECNLTLCGLLAFLDSPKDSASEAVAILKHYKVEVKVLTGDNELVAKKICTEIGIPSDNVILGKDIDKMNKADLRMATENTYIFAKLAPDHKQKIIQALKENGHVVGFMGDGINDAPALRQADVAISVDTAADIAKETSDIILLENNLLVLKDGILEGRKVFANIVKYLRMAASSNFGNVFSVVGASLIVPFLPMLPIQILTNNMLYDISQTAIPTDNVDESWLEKPRKWEIKNLRKYILFIGPVSSIFDYLTFFVLIHFFSAMHNPGVFQTGWYLESLITQTIIIHVLRTDKLPFIQSRASWFLTFMTLFTMAAGIALVYSSVAPKFGFVYIPPTFFIPITIFMVAYTLLTFKIKNMLLAKN